MFATLLLVLGMTIGDAPRVRGSGVECLGRSVIQDEGDWVILYRLRTNEKKEIPSNESGFSIEGEVSNSWVLPNEKYGPNHSMPLSSKLISEDESIAKYKLIEGVCEEIGSIAMWVEGDAPPDYKNGTPFKFQSFRVDAGKDLFVRLWIEHRHVPHTNFNPLLGDRDVKIRLGDIVIEDRLVMDRHAYEAKGQQILSTPPEDRLSYRYFVSAPSSLYLEVGSPGCHTYRFPEFKVRSDAEYRIVFWYLTALETQGEVRFRTSQYHDEPNKWKMLSQAGQDDILPVVGRWTRVEKVIRTDPETTTFAIDFRIAGPENLGEVWIDDVSMEPVRGGMRANP